MQLNSPTDTDTSGQPMPAASRMLAVLARDEPNDPFASDGTLADLFDDELGPGLREWAGALQHAAAKIRRHDEDDSSDVTEILERLGCLLAQAAAIADQAGPLVRGGMRPFPWLPKGQPPPGYEKQPDVEDDEQAAQPPADPDEPAAAGEHSTTADAPSSEPAADERDEPPGATPDPIEDDATGKDVTAGDDEDLS
jgi:hypothetical protein